MAFQLVIDDPETARRRWPLREGENLIGSDPACEVVLEDATISRHHALLVVTGDGLELADLGSTNGTFHLGRRLAGSCRIEPGEELGFGSLSAVLRTLDDSDAALVAGSSPSSSTGSDPGTQPAPTVPTTSVTPLRQFVLERLPRLVGLVREGRDPLALAPILGADLFQCVPLLHLRITYCDSEGSSATATLFSAGEEDPGGTATRLQIDARTSLHAVFDSRRSRDLHKPLLQICAHLLGIAAGDRSPPPASARTPARPPDPPSLSPVVQQLYTDAAKVAAGDVPVLIIGESGTGKELLARFVHDSSPRSSGPWITLNCAALPVDLLEAELFGIEKGVATGVESRAGKFELAHRGTLFLDEISDMAASAQAKILRVLQEKQVYRLGSRSPREADVRVVSATNRDLAACVDRGEFRLDLYHRIADWVAEMVPLRERWVDVPNLASYFLAEQAERLNRRISGISQAAMETLTAYSWPGNIRQLEREIARGVLFADDGGLLDRACLSRELVIQSPTADSLRATLERVERDEIAKALRTCSGDVSAAAERLAVSVATLYRKLKQHQLETSGLEEP